MDLAAPAAGGLAEPPEIDLVVVVDEEDGLAVIAALDDVRGDAGEEEAGLARHGRKRALTSFPFPFLFRSEKTWSVPYLPLFALFVIQYSLVLAVYN